MSIMKNEAVVETTVVYGEEEWTRTTVHKAGVVLTCWWRSESCDLHEEVAYSPVEKQHIENYLRTGEGLYYDLVRWGEIRGNDVRYYPVPLLFAGPEARLASARERDLPAPNERWVRKQQRKLLSYAGITRSELFAELRVE